MVKRYFTTFIVFVFIDMFWLVLVAPNFYKSQIGHLMSSDVNWIAALIFYLVYIAAILYFLVNEAINNGYSNKRILFRGAFLGFVMYATYDLTNLATLKQWPILVTVVDLIWGSFITSVTSFLSIKITKKFSF